MERIGRYEILRELGRGAMGVVYHARDPKIDREVAIKTIKLADQADESEISQLRDRLFREAQSAGKLSHPGIVTIYDVDEQDGLAYIAMEFVEGRTLEVVMKQGRVDDHVFAADVLKQTGAALDYAHQRGIVHRDVKPANLMLTSGGAVKIMDFGIARAGSSNLTQTGAVMGTPSYMSPEQVKGEEVDGRSDQFSLGVIAYEMVTGKKPFASESVTSVIFKIVSSAPETPAALCPWISPALDAVILKALSKSAADRFESCQVLADGFAQAIVSQNGAGEATTLVPTVTDPAESSDAADETSAATPVYDATAETSYDVAPPSSTPATSTPTTSAPTPGDSQKLPPLGAKPEGDAPSFGGLAAASEEDPDGRGYGRLLGIAAAIILILGVGAFFALNPQARNDPAGAIRAAFGMGGGTTAPPIEEDLPDELIPVGNPAESGAGSAGGPPDGAPGSEDGATAEASPATGIPTSTTSGPTPQSPGQERPEQQSPEQLTEEKLPEIIRDAPATTPDPESGTTDAAEAVAEAAEQPSPPPVEVAPPPRPVVARTPKKSATKLVSVYFRTTPPGAEIRVDGRSNWTCTSPCRITDLPAGKRTVTAKRDGYRTAARSLVLGDRSSEVYNIELEDARVQVLITSVPPGADIFIDGRKIAQKTNAKVPLAQGTYQIKVSKEGLGEAEQIVPVDREQIPYAKFVLEQP